MGAHGVFERDQVALLGLAMNNAPLGRAQIGNGDSAVGLSGEDISRRDSSMKGLDLFRVLVADLEDLEAQRRTRVGGSGRGNEVIDVVGVGG